MSTDLIRKLTYSQAGLLQRQVFLTQIGIFSLLTFPSLVLGGVFYKHATVGALIVLTTATYFLIIYRDKVFPQNTQTPLKSVNRIQRFRSHLGWLIGLDVVIVLSTIGLTGGILTSHVGFVLIIIPCVLAFVRGGGQTLLLTSLSIVLLIVFEVSLDAGWRPSGILAAGFTKIGGIIGYTIQAEDPLQSATHNAAYACGLIISVLITILQDYLSKGKAIPDRIKEEAGRSLQSQFSLEPTDMNQLLMDVDRAHQRAGRLISLTNEPDLHISVVHPINDTVFHAFIYAAPSTAVSFRNVRKAAEMVFLVHWLDDMFDYLGYTTLNEKEDLQLLTTKKIAESYHPYGIRRVIDRLKKIATWDDGAEIGLLRVILASYIQKGSTEQRKQGINKAKGEMLKLIHDDELREMVRSGNDQFVWGSAKGFMPLLFAMCCTGHETNQMKEVAVILDVLLMPILIWHNVGEESRREAAVSPGNTFTTDQVKIGEAILLAIKIFTHARDKLRIEEDTKFKMMVPIVKAFFANYQERMPLTTEYEKFRVMIKNLK